MKNFKRFCNVTALGLILSLAFACSPEEKAAPQRDSKYSSIPGEVMESIEYTARKHFADNEHQQKIWVNNQAEAWLRIEKYTPSITETVYKKIKETAEEKYHSEICERENFILKQVSAAERIHAASIHTDAKFFEFVMKKAETAFPNDYVKQDETAVAWIKFLQDTESKRPEFGEEDFERIRNVSDKASPDNPDEAYAVFSRHYDALMKINALNFGSDISHDLVVEAKKKAVEEYPDDMMKRFDYLNKARRELRAKKKVDISQKREEMEKLAAKERRSRYLYENTIFLNVDNLTKKAYPAVLVELKSRKVILASREYFFEEIPNVFSAAFGNFKTSEVFSSKSLPLMLVVPQEVSIGMLVSQEAKMSYENVFFSVTRPRGISLQSFQVKADSGEEEFINIKPQNERKAGKKYCEESAVVFDGDKSLLSFTVRIWDSQKMSEDMMNVMGAVSRNKFAEGLRKAMNGEAPYALNKFVRLSALENWEPVDAEKFAAQIKLLKDFILENKDIATILISGARNRDLSSPQIIEFINNYKKIAHEELNKNRRPEVLKGIHEVQMKEFLEKVEDASAWKEAAQKMYPAFKNEMEYQIALRKIMYEFLKKIIEANDILHITGSI